MSRNKKKKCSKISGISKIGVDLSKVGKNFPYHVPIKKPFYPETLWDIYNVTVLRIRKIFIYPNEAQKKILLEWFNIYRDVYNTVIKYIRKCKIEKKNVIMTRSGLRAAKSLFSSELIERIKTHKILEDTINLAISDVADAYKVAMKNLKLGNIKRFRLRYKKNKSRQTLSLDIKAFSKTSNAFAVKTLGIMKSSKPFKNIKHACKLQYSPSTSKFWLCVPTPQKTKEAQGRIEKCSLDPGMRSFLTLYDTEQCLSIGTHVFPKIYKLCQNLDKRKIAKGNTNPSWYKRYSRRIYDKIGHIVDDFHWKTTQWLCSKYDTIMIGKISTKNVVSKKGNLPKCLRQPMQSLSHYTFLDRLHSKAEQYNVKIIEVNEAYTTRTCGHCGFDHAKIGANKVFTCPRCGWTWDRDFNAARNIMLKALRALHEA